MLTSASATIPSLACWRREGYHFAVKLSDYLSVSFVLSLAVDFLDVFRVSSGSPTDVILGWVNKGAVGQVVFGGGKSLQFSHTDRPLSSAGL